MKDFLSVKILRSVEKYLDFLHTDCSTHSVCLPITVMLITVFKYKKFNLYYIFTYIRRFVALRLIDFVV